MTQKKLISSRFGSVFDPSGARKPEKRPFFRFFLLRCILTTSPHGLNPDLKYFIKRPINDMNEI